MTHKDSGCYGSWPPCSCIHTCNCVYIPATAFIYHCNSLCILLQLCVCCCNCLSIITQHTEVCVLLQLPLYPYSCNCLSIYIAATASVFIFLQPTLSMAATASRRGLFPTNFKFQSFRENPTGIEYACVLQ